MKWFIVEVLDRLFKTYVHYVRVEARSAKEAAKIIEERLSYDEYISAVYKETKWR